MPDHGTVSRYTNNGCRCDVCRAGNAQAQRARRARKFASRVRLPGTDRLIAPKAKHGTTVGYANYGCRCWECTAAALTERKFYRQKRASL